MNILLFAAAREELAHCTMSSMCMLFMWLCDRLEHVHMEAVNRGDQYT